MKITTRIIRFVVAVGMLCTLAAGQFGCPNPENGNKPPLKQTAQEEQASLERRIKEIQDNPNIPAQSKQMLISQMRGTAAKPPSNKPAH